MAAAQRRKLLRPVRLAHGLSAPRCARRATRSSRERQRERGRHADFSSDDSASEEEREDDTADETVGETAAVYKAPPPREIGEKPKGRLSAYLLFSNAKRPELVVRTPLYSVEEVLFSRQSSRRSSDTKSSCSPGQAEHRGLQADVLEQGRMLGAIWRDMTEAEKAPYHAAAAKDAERYADELEEYEQEMEEAEAAAEAAEAAHGSGSEDSGDDDDDDDDFDLKQKRSSGGGGGKRKRRSSAAAHSRKSGRCAACDGAHVKHTCGKGISAAEASKRAGNKRVRRSGGEGREKENSGRGPKSKKTDTSSARAHPPRPKAVSTAAQMSADSDYAEKWNHVLAGEGRENENSGRGLKSKKTDPAELREMVWNHRNSIIPGLRQPLMALEGATGKSEDSDPELLRSMLAELLLWCAPSSSPATALASAKVFKSSSGSGAEVGALEPGDFVTVDTASTQGQPAGSGWMAVKPLCFFKHDSKQRKQWLRATGGSKAGWVDGGGGLLATCRTSPRTLETLAATARGSLGNETTKEKKAHGLRAAEMLHSYLRGLALADGLEKGAQDCLLLLCDMLRGSSSAAATTKKLQQKGADVPLPKKEMKDAFEWCVACRAHPAAAAAVAAAIGACFVGRCLRWCCLIATTSVSCSEAAFV